MRHPSSRFLLRASKPLRLTVLALTVLSSVASAQAPSKVLPPAQMLSSEDQTFIEKAGQSGLAEVELNKLVLSRSTDPATKKIAQHMIDDHGKANKQLEALAKKLGTNVPTTPSEAQTTTKNKLAAIVEPKRFEAEYADILVKAHEKSVALFESQEANGKNSELKAWAAKTLPTIKHHDELAKAHQKAVEKKAGTSGTGNIE